MKFVADLHIHSHYSRATSKNLNFEHLSKWAQLKGVQVVGTGDIAHPGWLKEMREKLEPAEDGLFRLKEEYAASIKKEVPKACRGIVRFMLAGEISNIYKKNERVRKIHNVVFLPTFEAVEKFQSELEKIGNIRSDGRPILGLDARDLLEIVLNTDPRGYLIPAHIWTPWFSLFGSKSGFDTIEECFEDLTPHIFALETGLSSDPPMNWRLSALDRYTLVSNSDAHSPPKLAREANLFNTELSYSAIFQTLQTGDPQTFLGTVEFFPEEGKYHYDGHRKCEIRWDPKTTLEHNGICPICGKPVTVGVMHRVEILADREEGEKPERWHPFTSLIPLPEVLGEVYGVGAGSKRVEENLEMLLGQLGSELSILQELPLEDIEKTGGARLAEGIRRMRAGEIEVAAGYDGEYGAIKLFDKQEKEIFTPQLDLFGAAEEESHSQPEEAQAQLNFQDSGEKEEQTQSADLSVSIVSENLDTGRYGDKEPVSAEPSAAEQTPGKEMENENGLSKDEKTKDHPLLAGLNPQQQEAMLCSDVPLIIVAGPGTGKTRTLTHRMAYLIQEKGVPPDSLLAITFTNKAAGEMAERLKALLGPETAASITIKTFHAFGAMMLRDAGEALGLPPAFLILNGDECKALLKQRFSGAGEKKLNSCLEQISEAKNRLLTPQSPELLAQYRDDPELINIYEIYQRALQDCQALDYDDLILKAVELLEGFPEILRQYRQRCRRISVDEYQDINFAQYRLLRLLTGPENNLCVIGDPDQAIYGFRGASREYFLRFQKDFPGAKSISLNRNYRSTRNILSASRQVIAQGSEKGEGDLWSEIVSKTRLEIYQAPTHKAEAEYVVHQIEKMVGGTSYFSLDSGRVDSEDELAGRSFSDFAVLYRLGAQSHFLKEAFQRSGIPFQTAGQVPFYERKEIREILVYLWLLHNPDSFFHRQMIQERAANTLSFLGEFSGDSSDKPVAALIERIHEITATNRSAETASEEGEWIKKLVAKARPFENRLREFLEYTALQKETDEYDPRADRVALLTLHASKGLEFPVVFITGCEENLIPYRREGKPFDLDEERRLFYVGMTRAQEKLILTHAKKRFLFGQMSQNPPSRFLNDIETALKEFKEMMAKKKVAKDKPDDRQLKLF